MVDAGRSMLLSNFAAQRVHLEAARSSILVLRFPELQANTPPRSDGSTSETRIRNLERLGDGARQDLSGLRGLGKRRRHRSCRNFSVERQALSNSCNVRLLLACYVV